MRTHVLSAALLGTALLGCRGRVSPGTEPQSIVIENATVLPMDADRELTSHTVVVRNGVIVDVGPTGRVDVPDGATRIDARGLFVMPGLTDMHVHLYDTGGFTSYLRHGVTSVANLDGFAEVLDWRRRVASGALLGPTILTTGPSIDGLPPLNPLFEAADTPERARAIVQGQVAAGYDLLKVYSTVSPAVHAAIIDEARKLGVLVSGHVPRGVGARGVIAARQDNIAHVEEFFQLENVPDSAVAPLAGQMRAAGVYLTPNLFTYVDYLRSIADLPATLAAPEMRFASPAALSDKIPSNNRSIRPDPQGFAALLQSRLVRFRTVTRAMADSGVPLLLGTDTEIFGFAGSSAVSELEELVGAGLTPYQALAAGTVNAGRFMARSRRYTEQGGVPFGAVARGYRADLLLLEADPRRDVRNVTRMRGLVLRGRWLSRDRIDAARDSVASRHAVGRAAVWRFDSLIARGEVQQATREVRELFAKDTSFRPLARSTLLAYAFRAARTNPAAAREIRALGVDLYPRSPIAHLERARSDLLAGDTASARQHLATAKTLRPNDAVIDALYTKVDALQRPQTFDPVGEYDLPGITLAARAGPIPFPLSVRVVRSQTGLTARLRSPEYGEADATEVVAGADRIYITAAPTFSPPLNGRSVQLSLIVAADRISGTWTAGSGQSGAVEGRKR